MKTASLTKTLVSIGASLVIIILALIPFHAFLTVWGSSIVGHYTALRLWKEYLLVICLALSSYLFFTDATLRKKFTGNRLFWLIMAFLAVQVIWGLVFYHKGEVNKKALAYGLLIDCRFFIFFLVTWLLAIKTSRLKKLSIKLVIYPALVVVIFGLLEIFVLPRNFLSHFGYGPSTIPAYETINHNSKYIRIESTLRGANPLGAYMLIPLSLATVLFFRYKKSIQKILFTVGGLIVLVFSFSRSAWIGGLLSMASATFYSLKSNVLRRNLAYCLVVLIVIFVGLSFIFRNNTKVQNIVWHTQTHSVSKVSSDEAHSSALRSGIKNILANPIGNGPGSAGPASYYNNHPARIPENDYVQIGQETGWIGFGLFIIINVYVGFLLWLRRDDNLAVALLASLIGIFIINLFSQAWSDDTLSYLWWGLAGIALATKPKGTRLPDAG